MRCACAAIGLPAAVACRARQGPRILRSVGGPDGANLMTTEQGAREPGTEPTRSLLATWSGDPEGPRTKEVVLGEVIDRYQVRRLLGTGGMGEVYLARDVVLGRSVALKLVGGSVPTERFLCEARAIAALNHPNIVQLWNFGEYPRGVYLALEYVDGAPLRDRLRDHRMALDEALRIARAIADALVHAHACGVIHCDLKPSNVMVGRDGRVRIVDFGIARTADAAGGIRGGTPDWMAPEQRTDAPITDRVDSWALGLITAQLVHGGPAQEQRREPRRLVGADAADRADLPEPISQLIARALEHDPRARPSALEWRRGIDDVLGRRTAALSVDAPYPGLAAFEEPRARLYFGREREIDEFVERLRGAPCLPIVGPSGAGKSSFLHAGVIPRLRAQERLTVIALRPGRDPIGMLARHVSAALSLRADLESKAEVRALRADLLETPTLLAARLATVAAARETLVLVAIDQLEEAFTQGAPEAECRRFIEMLLGAADDPLDPIRIVFTVRDDFVGKLAGLQNLFVIEKLGREELRRAIAAPLEHYGYDFDDPALIDDLLAELGRAEAADLPLLQFACRALWEKRDAQARRLRRATYEEMGGISGALGRHAEKALAALGGPEQRKARHLLLQLVSGTARRSVARDQLVAVLGPDADPVIDRLLAARLLVQRTVEGEVPLVEIAHESLLQTWSQLARWVAESREERRLLEELEDATSLWERRGRRAEETWGPEDLGTARRRAEQLDLVLPARVQRFLAAGEERHRALRRRRRIRYGVAAAILSSAALFAFIWIGRYLERERLIRVNAGTLDLVLEPYDRIGGRAVPVALDELPAFSLALHATAPGDPHSPGAALPEHLVEILRVSTVGSRRTVRIRAPGGMAFLSIGGRGRRGEACAPSWIRIQAFPGYTETGAPELHEVQVPTCKATRDQTVRIPAGPFWYGGPGQPPSARYGVDPDYTEERRIITLPAYSIDKLEISNALFEPFARLEKLTGYPAPIYSTEPIHARDGDPEYPVTEINAYEAEAFCRYMGKQLPSDHQWTKAARGGLMVDGAENPLPERLFPWGGAPSPGCANQEGLEDRYRWVAPVTAFECGESPYLVRNLGGNVLEWISRDGQTDKDKMLHHALRGGAADSPPHLEHASTIFRNHSDPRAVSYSVGARCVEVAPP